MNLPIIWDIPIWVDGVVFLVIMLLALEVGYRMGVRRGPVSKDEESSGGDVATTAIFATLGLILAFTYAFTVARHQSRKQVVVDEANAISTAFLRAGLFQDPESAELKRALLNYARTRVTTRENTSSRAKIRETLSRSLDAQAKLWPITERIVKSRQSGAVEASLVAAMNQVLDLHTARIALSYDRIPPPILLMLLFASAASLGIAGFSSGLSGRFRRWRMTALALVLASVIFIIIDFDYPQQGFIRINQQPMISTIAQMEANLSHKE
jgi:hypothetical protein